MMDRLSAPPRIYNLFPRLVGDMTRWPEHARRARDMGFDWLYLNPFHYPGFSGSMYAVKDSFRVDPLLLPSGHPDAHYEDRTRGDGGIGLLEETIAAIRAMGLRPVMDLVINHTARDSALVHEHPDWYRRDAAGEVESPRAIDPADARRVTVWGDLAEIDNERSPDRERLWQHWEHLVEFYAGLGFEGFRADAAYKVPADLWAVLITRARTIQPEARFFAETLGARLEEIATLRPAGMHFLFSSAKWWDFSAPWCLEQQQAHSAIAPSVSFPESHDTPRLMAETGGSLPAQRQRYAFAAAFSSAVMMPVGYEFGARRRLDVVTTRSTDWEELACDLTPFITQVNAAKASHPALAGETVAAVNGLDGPTLILEKQVGAHRAWLAINKDWHSSHDVVLDRLPRTRALRVCLDGAPEEDGWPHLRLAPAEVAYLVPESTG